MHNDLIVMTFDREEGARRIYDSLQSMRKSPLLGLEDAAMVTVDSTGSVTFHQKRKLPVAEGATGGDLLSLIADLIFGDVPKEVVRALANGGLDDRFLANVARTMGNNSSALLFLVAYNSMSDTSELLGALALFRGKIHQTTLSSEAKATLLKMKRP
jgi:uncharacterized membrane protein